MLRTLSRRVAAARTLTGSVRAFSQTPRSLAAHHAEPDPNDDPTHDGYETVYGTDGTQNLFHRTIYFKTILGLFAFYWLDRLDSMIEINGEHPATTFIRFIRGTQMERYYIHAREMEEVHQFALRIREAGKFDEKESDIARVGMREVLDEDYLKNATGAGPLPSISLKEEDVIRPLDENKDRYVRRGYFRNISTVPTAQYQLFVPPKTS